MLIAPEIDPDPLAAAAAAEAAAEAEVVLAASDATEVNLVERGEPTLDTPPLLGLPCDEEDVLYISDCVRFFGLFLVGLLGGAASP